MAEQCVTISKLGPRGEHLYSYPGTVIYRDDQVIAARCVWDMPRTVDLGPFAITPRDILIECFYYSEPYNIFAVYDAAGRLKGWYCNLLAYTEIAADTIGWADLALDLVVTPQGEEITLDQDEFDALEPSPAERQRAADALNGLLSLFRERRYPFALGSHTRR